MRNRSAAAWEREFYDRIGEEGVTEIVVGDAGVGIVESLRKIAREHGASSAKEVLQHAFDPYSTSKDEKVKKTRGLWCVKQKVRDFGGLLYVRTCESAASMERLSSRGRQPKEQEPGVGVVAYWDFLNNPDQEEPCFVEERSWFPGTQYQILLPQHKHDRPKTVIALHVLEGLRKRSIARPVAIPARPGSLEILSSLGEAIRMVGRREVLFIDMSQMNKNKEPVRQEWDRDMIDSLMKVVCNGMVMDRERSLWLLNHYCPGIADPELKGTSVFAGLHPHRRV